MSGVPPFPPDSTRVDAVVAAANAEPRRGVVRPTMLVLHYTGMRHAAKAIEWLALAESKVSCHYVVDEAGLVTQMVPEAMRAWHAGVSCWAGATDLNSASVGIEIHNPGHDLGYADFAAAQIDAVIHLARDICQRQPIRRECVLAHSDIAPMRKTDPGEKFPWHRLAAAGIGHWAAPSAVREADLGIGPGASGVGVAAAQRLFAAYGYDIPCDGAYDTRTEMAVRAFQRHFRPERCDGRLDLSTLATLERLLAALTVPAV